MSAATDQPTSFRWDRLTIAAAASFCMLVSALSTSLVLPELRDQFHINGVVSALHGSTFGIGLIFFGMFGVRVVARLGRRRAVLLSILAIAVGVTAFVFGPAWPITLGATVVSGFGAALMVMAMPGIINDHHNEHRAAAYSAINATAGIVGIALSLAVGFVLGAGGSWRVPYIVFTAVVTVIVLFVGRNVDIPAAADAPRFSLRHLRHRDVFVPWLQLMHAILTDFAVGVWAVTYLREVGSASAGAAPILGTAFAVAMAASRIKLAPIRARLGESTVSLCYGVSASGVALLCFAPQLWLRVVGLAVFAFGAGVLYPMAVDTFYARAGHLLDSVSIGAYAALANGLAVVIGPLALGVLADLIELRWAILTSLVLSLLGVFTHLSRRRY